MSAPVDGTWGGVSGIRTKRPDEPASHRRSRLAPYSASVMKVVVTGGAGFIGANLCARLTRDPDVSEVVAFDDLSTGVRTNLDGIDATFAEADILDPAALDRAFDGATSVVHLAARPSVPRSLADPMRSHVVNATGTVEVLEAARRAGNLHVVVASSSSVYGANPALPKHESATTLPLSPYAASKLATEAYALSYQHSFGLPALAFRFFNVFGPLQPAGHAYAAVVPAFVSAALEGRPLPVQGDGRQSRDFTFVGTVADVLAESRYPEGHVQRAGQPRLRQSNRPARRHRAAVGDHRSPARRAARRASGRRRSPLAGRQLAAARALSGRDRGVVAGRARANR